MFSPHSPNAAPNPPQMPRGTPPGLSKKHSQAGSSNSGPDWLGPAILAARTITAAGECLPFPYIKGAFGIVDQIILHRDTAAVKLKGLCENFERFLRNVILEVETMQKKSEGIRGHITEFFKSSRIQDSIAGYQKHIQEICSQLKLMVAIDTNFQVHEIKTALATGISSSIMLI
ncbi:hypothetical protein B0H19DRAFT_1230450 [Mycena capillaripes]|nr:hypothetical protein B0H19DRAFT_1230450 [Mycena capillaripes]